MKKAVALLLVVAMVFAFASCKKDEATEETTTGVPFDKEVLAANWQDGSITFENGNTVTLPCDLSSFLRASGLTLQNADKWETKKVAAGKSETLRLFKGTDTEINITCENPSKEEVAITNTKVVKFSFKRGGSDTLPGNKLLKFAGTLTVNASRTEVEEVLGTGSVGSRGIVTYAETNSANKKFELKITYGDNNLISNVSYEIV
jgi:hypothetical protein